MIVEIRVRFISSIQPPEYPKKKNRKWIHTGHHSCNYQEREFEFSISRF